MNSKSTAQTNDECGTIAMVRRRRCVCDALFHLYGPLNAGGVFFLPLLKSYGWGRARLAALWRGIERE
jgi:hypothetical protein